jgi:hypothetical protein
MTSHHAQNFRKNGAAVRSESDPSIYQTVENVDPCQIAYSAGQLFSACGKAPRLQIYKVEVSLGDFAEDARQSTLSILFLRAFAKCWKGLAGWRVKC